MQENVLVLFHNLCFTFQIFYYSIVREKIQQIDQTHDVNNWVQTYCFCFFIWIIFHIGLVDQKCLISMGKVHLILNVKVYFNTDI